MRNPNRQWGRTPICAWTVAWLKAQAISLCRSLSIIPYIHCAFSCQDHLKDTHLRQPCFKWYAGENFYWVVNRNLDKGMQKSWKAWIFSSDCPNICFWLSSTRSVAIARAASQGAWTTTTSTGFPDRPTRSLDPSKFHLNCNWGNVTTDQRQSFRNLLECANYEVGLISFDHLFGFLSKVFERVLIPFLLLQILLIGWIGSVLCNSFPRWSGRAETGLSRGDTIVWYELSCSLDIRVILGYVHRNWRNHCLKIWNLGFVHFGSTDPLRHGERNGRSWISETQLSSCLAHPWLADFPTDKLGRAIN